MKKRLTLFLVFVLMLTAGVFAQKPKHFISGELSILGIGARYEYKINDYLSVGAYAYTNLDLLRYLIPLDTAFSWGIGGSLRWYPFGKLFYTQLEAGFGYHKEFGWIPSSHIYSGLDIAVPGIGWTIDVGSPGRFFISCGLKGPVFFNFGPRSYVKLDGSEYLEVSLGLIAFFGMGYAF